MKALVKKSFVLVLVSLFVFSVSAQRPDKSSKTTPEDRATRQTEMMTKQLNLTADQQAKIKEINLKYSQQQVGQRSQAKEQMKQNRENMKTQMNARDAEIKQVLTPEQLEKWQAKRNEMKQQGREKGTENKLKRHRKPQTQNAPQTQN